MPPLALSDEQLDAVFRAARPLRVADRDAFLQEVAAALQGRSEIGDGDVYRAIAEVQRKFWDPPQLAISRQSIPARQTKPAVFSELKPNRVIPWKQHGSAS
jgi:hypothetical protein